MHVKAGRTLIGKAMLDRAGDDCGADPHIWGPLHLPHEGGGNLILRQQAN
jgi:hypothetical protein